MLKGSQHLSDLEWSRQNTRSSVVPTDTQRADLYNKDTWLTLGRKQRLTVTLWLSLVPILSSWTAVRVSSIPSNYFKWRNLLPHSNSKIAGMKSWEHFFKIEKKVQQKSFERKKNCRINYVIKSETAKMAIGKISGLHLALGLKWAYLEKFTSLVLKIRPVI